MPAIPAFQSIVPEDEQLSFRHCFGVCHFLQGKITGQAVAEGLFSVFFKERLLHKLHPAVR
ncbi:Uncharacterised protein [Mycobacteroides abscessus subsp. abscessus]|nr:Uncharacterised protein [Mycobacteroides abscessus subsp. abscessus]